jgi:RNA polymerase sigma factor (TIGR02999 family)
VNLADTESSGDLTKLLSEVAKGDKVAASQLVPLVYSEMRRLAAAYMRRERENHTLQATALVHEAYLKLVDQRTDWQSRAHFFGVAAQVMRHILIDHARGHSRAKRGGAKEAVTLDEGLVFSDEKSEELLALDEALQRLAKLDTRQAKVVEMRFFGGLTVEETAEALSISPITVKRDWSLARAWLYGELERQRHHAERLGKS